MKGSPVVKLLRLELQDFLSYESETISLAGLDYVAVVGANGSGKSTIPLAIAWALFGTNRVRGDNDSVVRDEAESATVTLDIEDRSGQQWRIVRTRNWGASGIVRLFHADGQQGWVQFGDHRNATAEEQIAQLVGMDEDAFYSLVLMDQSSTAGGTRFTRADSKQRRAILLSLLPELAVWSELEESARVRLTGVRRERELVQHDTEQGALTVTELTERIASLKGQLSGEDRAQLHSQVAELDAELNRISERVGSLTSDRATIKAEMSAAEAAHQLRVERLHNTESDLRGELALREELTDDILRTTTHLEQLSGELQDQEILLGESLDDLAELEQEQGPLFEERERVAERERAAADTVRDVESKLAARVERIQGLQHQSEDSDRCWVCGTHLSPQQHAQILSDLLREQEEGHAQLATASGIHTTLRRKLDRLDERERELQRKLSGLRITSRDAERGVAECVTKSQELQHRVEALRAELAEVVSEGKLRERLEGVAEELEGVESTYKNEIVAVLKQRLSELEGSSESRELEHRLSELQRERGELQRELSEYSQREGALAEAERSRAGVVDSIKGAESRERELGEQEGRLSWLSTALSAKGVPSMLLDSVLTAIEDSQNSILAALPGTENMRVEFRQTRELKSREGKRDVLDIIVHTADGYERPIESFSFGERVRLTISNLFAMVQVFNERTGGLVNTLFLDEPLGPLDEESVPAFVEVLRAAMNTGIVSSIFVVTHDSRVIDALPQRMMISRSDGGGSRVDAVL